MAQVEKQKLQSEPAETVQSSDRELLEEIWEDKRGREVLNAPPEFALYIALPRPGLDLAELGKALLEEMENKPQKAHVWSRQWGMTVVGFHPGKHEFGVRLLSTSSPERHPYVPIETNIQFLPSEVFELIRLGEGRHRIDLNDTPTTIEGIAISLTHLLEWSVWETYRSLKEESVEESDEALFAQAISVIKEDGVVIKPASQEEILACYQLNRQQDSYTVRLYGSQACSAVPFVIGGVLTNAGESLGFGEVKACPLILTPTSPNPLITESLMPNEEVEFRSVEKPLVVCGATLGKRLHAGHLLTLTTAHIMQAAFNGEGICFISNNTGPRVVKAIATYAQETGIPIKEAASLWKQGKLSPWEIEKSYRSRGTAAQDSCEEIMRLLPEDDYLISMTNWLDGILSRIGFSHTKVVTESAYFSNWSPFCSRVDLEWTGSGFAFARLGRHGLGGVPLQNGSEYSVVAKFVAAFDKLCQGLGKDGVLIVDNTLDASYMAQVTRRYLGIGAEQTAGGAVGFGLRIVSGTSGEAPPIDSIFKAFKDRVGPGEEELPEEAFGTKFRNALVQFINTSWAIAPRLAGRQTDSHFEFAKPAVFVQSLICCSQEAQKLKGEVRAKMSKLTTHRTEGGLLSRETAQKVLRLVQTPEKLDPSEVVRGMNTYEVWEPKKHDLQELATILGKTGHSLTDQVEIAQKIAQGELVLVKRISLYFALLMRLMEALDEETTISLPPEIAQKAACTLETAFIRAGYTF